MSEPVSEPPSIAPPPESESPPATAPSAMAPLSERAMWTEVVAVLAVGVLPWLCDAILSLVEGSQPRSFWSASFSLTWHSLCIIFVVLYLIRRSGESWETFGLVRPQWGDLAIALALVLLSEVLWFRVASLLLDDHASTEKVHPSAANAVERVVMVMTYLVSGFSEELVTRAYLITRLERLLQSRWQAVMMSAVAFASYHIYYGFGATFLYMMLFGMAFGGFYLVIRRLWPFALAHALINIYIDLRSVAA